MEQDNEQKNGNTLTVIYNGGNYIYTVTTANAYGLDRDIDKVILQGFEECTEIGDYFLSSWLFNKGCHFDLSQLSNVTKIGGWFIGGHKTNAGTWFVGKREYNIDLSHLTKLKQIGSLIIKN